MKIYCEDTPESREVMLHILLQIILEASGNEIISLRNIPFLGIFRKCATPPLTARNQEEHQHYNTGEPVLTFHINLIREDTHAIVQIGGPYIAL